jgi:uncharacterized phiE125 gp8 family phage protein
LAKEAKMTQHPAIVITQPTTFPISTAEAKLFSGIDGDAEDSFVAQLIAAATKYFQQHTGHALAETTYSQVFDCFPRELRFDWTPIYSVTWLKYYATDGTLTTLGTGNYWTSLNSRPPRIIPVYNVPWPSVQYGRPECVELRYVAGYHATGDIEEGIKVALLNLVKHWYTKKDVVIDTGAVPQEVPFSLESLIQTYSMRGYR